MVEVTERYAVGTPCWVDLSSRDQQAALDFYRDLLGWQGEVGAPEFGGYAVCALNGRPVAGIMGPVDPGPGQPAVPPSWTTYLATDDAEATLTAIGDNGGTVLLPVMTVGDTGKMLVAADPSGAVFGVWEPLEFLGAQVVNEAGAVVWNELHTSAPGEVGAFYNAVFGARVAPMEQMPEYLSYEVEGRSVGGVLNLADDPPGTPPHWRTYFAADDVDSTVDALVKAGGNVLSPPTDQPWGRVALVQDRDGATFSLITPAPM
ncbi:VOC family protein [Kitasatospora sp. NPDC002040]|uniref:VOC family protein n=1 Tax=Kitasatospora sp. NPDC002040 TaxID=3154661 RepID=UPI0033204D2B